MQYYYFQATTDIRHRLMVFLSLYICNKCLFHKNHWEGTEGPSHDLQDWWAVPVLPGGMLMASRPKSVILLWGLAVSLVGPLGRLPTALPPRESPFSLAFRLMPSTFASLLNPFFSNNLHFRCTKARSVPRSFFFFTWHCLLQGNENAQADICQS